MHCGTCSRARRSIRLQLDLEQAKLSKHDAEVSVHELAELC
jgi:hypothetical protein